MSKNNARQRRRARRAQPKTPQPHGFSQRKLMAIIGIVMLLGLTGAILARWRTAGSGTRSNASLAPASVPLPTPTPLGLSKEYIYAGGKLVATEEPGSGANPLSAPGGLVATTISSSQLNLSWTASTGPVDHYQIERRQKIDLQPDLSVSTNGAVNNFNDTGVAPGKAYLYIVRAVDMVGNVSPDSNRELATAVTFTDDPLPTAPMRIKALHLTELRQAIDAVRFAAALGPATWTDSSPGGVRIKALHVQEMRTAIDQALSALSLPVQPYTDPDLTQNARVKKEHFEQLRQRVK